MAAAYFVCHIGPIYQISLIYAFIGCPQTVILVIQTLTIVRSKSELNSFIISLFFLLFFFLNPQIPKLKLKFLPDSTKQASFLECIHFVHGAEKLVCIKKKKKVEGLNDVTSALLCSKFKPITNKNLGSHLCTNMIHDINYLHLNQRILQLPNKHTYSKDMRNIFLKTVIVYNC